MTPSISPEHDKRDGGDHGSNLPNDAELHPDLNAAYDYVQGPGMLTRLPGDAGPQTHPGYLWHGWAIREAFLAGVTHAQAQQAELLAQARADAFEAAAKVCDKRAQSRTGYAYDGAEQDEAEACAAEIRAQGQGQGGGNG